jgi:malate permease and related proteins
MLLQLLDIFVNNIAPILLVAGIGFYLARRFEIDARSLGRVTFNVFSPALVFYSLSHNEVRPQELGQILLAVALYTSILALVTFVLVKIQGHSRIEQAGVMLCALTPNNGNYGVPLIALAFGGDVLADAVIVFVIMVMVQYTVGVYIASSGHKSTRDALATVLRVPMFYALLAGLILNLLDITIPAPIDRSLKLMADGSFPLMLIMLGIQLSRARLDRLRPVILATMLRMFVAPLIALAVVIALGLPSAMFIAIVVQASMPVAVNTTVLAMEFELSQEQISGSVLLSTLLSPLTLSFIILAFRQTFNLGG